MAFMGPGWTVNVTRTRHKNFQSLAQNWLKFDLWVSQHDHSYCTITEHDLVLVCQAIELFDLPDCSLCQALENPMPSQ